MKLNCCALIAILNLIINCDCTLFQTDIEISLLKFELLSNKAKTEEDAFPDIKNILNDCKTDLEGTASEKANAAVILLKLLSVLHGREQYCGSNAFISDETPKAHKFWTIYAGLIIKTVENLDEIEAAMKFNALKSILTLTDFYNIIDQLNAPVRVCDPINSDSDTNDLFAPYELVMPILLVILKDGQSEQFSKPLWVSFTDLFYFNSPIMEKQKFNETLFYGSEPGLSFIIDTANTIVALVASGNVNEISFQYEPKFKIDDFQYLFEQNITKEMKLKWHKRNFKFYMQNQRDISERAYADGRREIPIVAAFCILHQIAAEGFEIKKSMAIEEILDLFAVVELQETRMAKLVYYFEDWLKRETSINDEMLSAHVNICKRARELSDEQIETFPIGENLNDMELLKTHLRFVNGSYAQTRGPFAKFNYRLIKYVVENDQWHSFEGFFDDLNKMETNFYVIPSKGSGYPLRMEEIEQLLERVLVKLDEILGTNERKEEEITLLFSMLLYNAAEELTDFMPGDISNEMKNFAVAIFRVIVDAVDNGQLESFENNSLFRAAMREFIRNFSRFADQLRPKRSEDTRILRNRAPEGRKSDRAYFIFYLKIAYGFSLTFNCDKLTNNLIESMLELEPPNYEQDDISLVFEKNNFLSARGRRVGEIIAEKFDSDILVRNFQDLLRCYTQLEFVQQFTPESNSFNVLYTDKMQFKRGIIEALHTIIGKTIDLPALKKHPEMIAKLNRLTDSFIHESNADLPAGLAILINNNKEKLTD